MAVWMQIVGGKTTPESINEIVEECRQVLTNSALDLAFLQGTLEPKTAYEALHKKLKPEYWSYNKSDWIMEIREQSVGLYYPLYEDTEYKHDSIRISLYKDMLSINGPFDHFSHYGTIVQEEQLKRGYQNIVRQICTGFKVKEVVYFSEWCYSTDDFDSYWELRALLSQIPQKQVQELNQIWYGQEYYIEEMNR